MRGAGQHAADAGLAHEHVVGFFGQHEFGGARQRVKRAFRQGRQLELAVAVGKVREHKKRQPVGCGLVEGTQYAWVVFVAAAPLQQGISFFTTIAAKVFVQQKHHGPQVAAFFHIDLEQVAHVVHARRGERQVPLLLDGSWFGVALRDDDAAQVGAVFTGHVVPGFFALVVAKMDGTVGHARVHENAPAVVAHLGIAKLRPALWVHADGRAQVHVVASRSNRAHVVPPVDEVGLPAFQRALQGAVFGEVDVVGDFFAVIDGAHGVLLVKMSKIQFLDAKGAKVPRRTRKKYKGFIDCPFVAFAQFLRLSRPGCWWFNISNPVPVKGRLVTLAVHL